VSAFGPPEPIAPLAGASTSPAALFDCRACGACCAFSAEWPRFTTEDDADLARLPPEYVDDARGRMRCRGDRCAALRGVVGVEAACAVYADRPEVCRACEPGDGECLLARRRFGLRVG
jgi:Fe-S-cluster containining protein